MSKLLQFKIWLSSFKQRNDVVTTSIPRQGYLFLDESGQVTLGDKKRYYILAGILTTNLKGLNKTHKEVSRTLRFKKNIEYKGSKMNNEQRLSFMAELSKLRNTNLVALVFDKEKWDNIKDKDAVNNFLIRHLIKYLKKSKIYILNKAKIINIILDQRTSYVGNYQSLRKYLSPHFQNQRLNVFLADSSKHRGLQYADILANTLHRFYNNKIKVDIIIQIQKRKKLYLSMYPIPKHYIDKHQNYNEKEQNNFKNNI